MFSAFLWLKISLFNRRGAEKIEEEITEEFMGEMFCFTLKILIPIRYNALNIYLINRPSGSAVPHGGNPQERTASPSTPSTPRKKKHLLSASL
ncbi:hypothetical protein H6G41_11990 [Tolypothrix sp. FACHB-123]|uniref:hypothetical protein n=1 Tax=Tolypothrix sp. FACHB-123 TaxID=2692868 RepID=UPI001682CD2C|nr:hypothetical protein [Tolypothrix sp. FACHB-123]MBD2355330.1 hypothetical protein [Tolypothrix sp. FACHB-123]